jgi:anti-sigma B factor antagonist
MCALDSRVTADDSPTSFTVGVERRGSAVVARPSGDLDMATVPRLREAVEREREEGDVLVLDLRGLAFLDTSGMRYVVEQHSGRELTLVRGTDAVQRIFEIAGLEEELSWVDDPEDAVST